MGAPNRRSDLLSGQRKEIQFGPLNLPEAGEIGTEVAIPSSFTNETREICMMHT